MGQKYCPVLGLKKVLKALCWKGFSKGNLWGSKLQLHAMLLKPQIFIVSHDCWFPVVELFFWGGGTFTWKNDICVSPRMTVRWLSAPCAPPLYCHAILAHPKLFFEEILMKRCGNLSSTFLMDCIFREFGAWNLVKQKQQKGSGLWSSDCRALGASPWSTLCLTSQNLKCPIALFLTPWERGYLGVSPYKGVVSQLRKPCTACVAKLLHI